VATTLAAGADRLSAVSTTDTALELDLEAHRRELTGYCYRMLGSSFEAEDAVQETMVRAWKNYETFEGRSALRSWLYRIATNVCLDMLRSSQRRARPMDMGPATTTENASLAQLGNEAFVEPIQDVSVLDPAADPAEQAEYRETIRIAFVAALQHLPPRQRAVLILREVLRWQASEVAELLDSSVASVNSALQRARATLEEVQVDETSPAAVDPRQAEVLARYVAAFESYDIDSLVTLLHDEVKFCMPPYEMWLNSPLEVGRWMLGPGSPCRGSRLLATSANGCPALAQYRPDPAGGWAPWNMQVLEIAGGRITGVHNFLNTELFGAFGFPPRLDP
jgi:RNA polymerase sigma-70 factor (ECF subfamily)